MPIGVWYCNSACFECKSKWLTMLAISYLVHQSKMNVTLFSAAQSMIMKMMTVIYLNQLQIAHNAFPSTLMDCYSSCIPSEGSQCISSISTGCDIHHSLSTLTGHDGYDYISTWCHCLNIKRNVVYLNISKYDMTPYLQTIAFDVSHYNNDAYVIQNSFMQPKSR